MLSKERFLPPEGHSMEEVLVLEISKTAPAERAHEAER
jgi:hypothetical protein